MSIITLIVIIMLVVLYTHHEKQEKLYKEEIAAYKTALSYRCRESAISKLEFHYLIHAVKHTLTNGAWQPWAGAKNHVLRVLINEPLEVQQQVINELFKCEHTQEAVSRQLRRLKKGKI